MPGRGLHLPQPRVRGRAGEGTGGGGDGKNTGQCRGQPVFQTSRSRRAQLFTIAFLAMYHLCKANNCLCVAGIKRVRSSLPLSLLLNE